MSKFNTNNDNNNDNNKEITLELSTSTRRLSVLFSLFGATDYIGEPLSISEHSLQCAYLASLSDPIDEELIIACLLHDIGHLLGLEAGQTMAMGGCGVEDHENIGGDFILELGFSKRISNFVRNHVSAKRYLCYKHKSYYDNLSPASKTTLGYQGGPMTDDEGIAYESDPEFKAYLLMRSFDEAAKEENMNVKFINIILYLNNSFLIFSLTVHLLFK
jgi:predicted HD phosphohydrolase